MENSKYIDRIQVKLDKISQNRYLKAVSRSMVMTIPAVITGSLAVLLNNLPIDAYQNFLEATGVDNLLILTDRFTAGVLALIVTFFVAYNIANAFDVDGNLAGITSLLSFFVLTPLSEVDINGDGNLVTFISFDWIGARGMFVAILVGLFVGRMFALFVNNKLYIRMPKTVPSFVEKSFAAIFPFFSIIVICGIFSLLMTYTDAGNIHEIVYGILQVPLQGIGASIGGIIVAYIAMNLFWWFGIHGKALVFAIVAPIWQAVTNENLAAANMGEEAPHLMDIGSNTIFFEIGGSTGAMLAFAILLVLFAKSEQYKSMGRLGIVPAFFGISEPLVFGTPIVLNPLFLLPTIIAPLVTGLIGYIGIVSGFVPAMRGIQLPTGTPTFINAFIIANWQGVVVQLIGLIAAIGVWYPFFRLADKKAIKEEQETLNGNNSTLATE